jgi:hypothetical protein
VNRLDACRFKCCEQVNEICSFPRLVISLVPAHSTSSPFHSPSLEWRKLLCPRLLCSSSRQCEERINSWRARFRSSMPKRANTSTYFFKSHFWRILSPLGRSGIFFLCLAQGSVSLIRSSRVCSVVIRALAPLDKSRKCFRLIGGVMVERNVGEVLPAVTSNRDNVRVLAFSFFFCLAARARSE